MIKTLRITSILAAAFAVIFVGFFVFRIVQGAGGDEKVRELLKSPNVIEKFKAAEGDRAKTIVGQISPLEKEAKSFALYLNPPASRPKIDRPGGDPKRIPQVNVTPKFKVIGISYYEGRPEMSMALIDEPGKGIHWVKQSTTVGHLFVEQVENDLVIVKSGSETFRLTPERKPQSALSSGGSSAKPPVKPANTVKSNSVSSSKRQLPSRIRNIVQRPPKTSSKTQKSNKEKERLEELYEELKVLQVNTDSNDSGAELSEEERNEQIKEIISNFKASNVSMEEAKELEDLGEQLKVAGEEEEPNLIDSKDL